MISAINSLCLNPKFTPMEMVPSPLTIGLVTPSRGVAPPSNNGPWAALHGFTAATVIQQRQQWLHFQAASTCDLIILPRWLRGWWLFFLHTFNFLREALLLAAATQHHGKLLVIVDQTLHSYSVWLLMSCDPLVPFYITSIYNGLLSTSKLWPDSVKMDRERKRNNRKPKTTQTNLYSNAHINTIAI